MYFRPYDLLVVSRSQIGCEYYTMSATGVMHIRKGSQAEFTPLADWVRERSMFDLIRQIGYFKKYLTGRAFSRWHQVRCCAAM
jgi:dynein heavy chain